MTTHLYRPGDLLRVTVAPGVTVDQCAHQRETTSISQTTDQISHFCPDCRTVWTTWPDRAAPNLLEVAEVIDAWRTSPLRSHDGRLFDAMAALAAAHGIDLAATPE